MCYLPCTSCSSLILCSFSTGSGARHRLMSICNVYFYFWLQSMWYWRDAQLVPSAPLKIHEFPQHESARCRLNVFGPGSCLMQGLLLPQKHSKNRNLSWHGSACGCAYSPLCAYFMNSHEWCLIMSDKTLKPVTFHYSPLFFTDEITNSFRRYGHLVVDWPHKAESKSYFPPKGKHTFSQYKMCFPITSKSTPINISMGMSQSSRITLPRILGSCWLHADDCLSKRPPAVTSQKNAYHV